MDAHELIRQTEALGVRLHAEGDRLVASPAHRLSSELRQALIARKPELLRIAPRRRWQVALPGRPPFSIDCVGLPVSPDEIRARWPYAKVEPQS